jgi:hypothetical protein
MINLNQNGEFKNILIKGMLAEGWQVSSYQRVLLSEKRELDPNSHLEK